MRLAIDQCAPLGPGLGFDAGLSRLDEAARRAAGAGADILISPEMALTGYVLGAEEAAAAAIAEDGPEMAAISAIAAARGVALVAGFPLRSPEGALNAAALFDAAGRRRALYAKTHLYGAVDAAQFAPGAALSPIIAFGEWRLALAICYDVEFPELVRAAALAGAELLLVPTANMTPYDSVSTRLVPARAEENAMAVAYANYCGSDSAFTYFGLSCIVGPDGEDLARAGAGAEMIFADLSREALALARAAQTHLQDRRPDLYGSLA